MEGDELVQRAAGLWSHPRDMTMRSQRGLIDWVSPSVVEVLGDQTEDLVGCTAADITHPDDLAGALRSRALLVELGVSHLRARVRHKDGSYRWMDIRAQAEPDDNAEDVMLSTWRDVTDDVAALEAIERSRDDLRLIAEHSSDVGVRGSEDGRIDWASPSIRTALGYVPDDLLGTTFVSLLHHDDRHLASSAQRRLRAGEIAVFEARIARADGGWRWFTVRVVPVVDAAGHLWHVATGRDIETEVEERAARERAGAGLAATLQLVLDPHVVLDAVRDTSGAVIDFVIADVNEAAAEYIRRPKSELVGARLLDVMPRQATSGMLDRYRSILETGEPLRLDGFEYDHEVHGKRWADVRAVRVGDSIAYTFRDVTERIALAAQIAAREHELRSLAEVVPDVMVRIRDGRFDYLSPSLTTSLGWRPDDLLGRLTSDVVHPDDFPLVLDLRATLATEGGPVRYRMRVLDSAGTYRWVEVHGDIPPATQDEPGVFVGTLRLIDDQVAAEADLRQRAATDALTGLMNRHGVLDHLTAVTRRPARSGREIALIYADVDGLKHVNDTRGHSIGDRLLNETAHAMVSVVRHSDAVARLGGDEFLIVLLGVTTLDAAATVADKIRAAVRAVVVPGTNRGGLTISAGVTLCHRGESVDTAIERADRAMYLAKRAGGDRTHVLPHDE